MPIRTAGLTLTKADLVYLKLDNSNKPTANYTGWTTGISTSGNISANNLDANGECEALSFNCLGVINFIDSRAISMIDGVTNGTGNLFIGMGIALSNSGNYNTFIGHTAGYDITSGNSNTIIGYSAGNDITTQSSNVFIGYRSGKEAISSAATGIGADSARNTQSAITAIGYRAAYQNSTGTNNTAIGNSCLYYNTTSSGNTAVGFESGYGSVLNVFGSNNTLLGYRSGYALTTGSGNVFIGKEAGSQQTTGSNKLFIANSNTNTPLIYGEFDNAIVTINGAFDATGKIDSNQYYTLNGSTALNFLDTYTNGTNCFFMGPNAGANNAAGSIGDMFIGNQAGEGNTTGDYNLAIGYQALEANQTADYNTAIGFQALQNCISEGQLAIGFQAGMNIANTSGKKNICIGFITGGSITTGGSNTLIGYLSGRDIVSGQGNTFIGESTGFDYTGDYCTAIGLYAMLYNVTGVGNVCIGSEAGKGVVSNSYDSSVYIGMQPGFSVTTGSRNVGIGYRSLYYNATGQYNTCMGYEAGWGSSGNSQSNNTIIGYRAGRSFTSGGDNTYIGYLAGYLTTSGGSNIFIGRSAGYRQTTLSNLLIVDNQSRASAAVEAANAILYGVMASAPANQTLTINANTKISQIKSGATQAGAGAAANELWKTASHATLPDNVVMIGV